MVSLAYAESKRTVTMVDSYTEKVKNNEYVIKAIDIVKKCQENIKSGWEGFKKWFSKLPGIKQYNESVYSGKNWKKTMNSMGEEYKPHLQPNAAGFKMLKQGKKKWDNL
jgi:hypothetical protein